MGSKVEAVTRESYSVLSPSVWIPVLLIVPVALYYFSRSSTPSPSNTVIMSTKADKRREGQNVAEFKEITGASMADSVRFVRKFKDLETAIDAYFNDPRAQSSASSQVDQARVKKLGDIWEKYKESSNPKLITIEGTLEWCQELGVDPSSDAVLFCLATDLGSKVTGEWEKEPFVSGWANMPGNIDSIEGMKQALPGIRKKLNADPVYFKRVYMHTFDLAKKEGARTLALDTAIDLWGLYLPPALEASPSALSRIPTGEPPNSPSTANPPEFTNEHFELWIEFQKKKGKAISKDTWSLFIDFVRSIDKDFKEYDDSAAWPSTIDDFVDHVRAQK